MTHEQVEKMADALSRYQKECDRLRAENSRLKAQIRANNQQRQQEEQDFSYIKFEPGVGHPAFRFNAEQPYDPKELEEHKARQKREQDERNRYQANLNANSEQDYQWDPAPGSPFFKWEERA